MACAQTGSGKTAAFLLPTINGMLVENEEEGSGKEKRGSSRAVYPRTLILAPTRELATQIFEEARKFTYCTGLRPVVVYGGAEVGPQLRQLEQGVDILVATPGRLGDVIERGRVSLKKVQYLILDEADRMLDMGFEPQIRHIVEECDMPVENRQTLMFSATFPREIQRLASDFLESDYVFVSIGRVGSTNDFITQNIEYAEEGDKRDRLMRLLLDCEGLTVIFVETKRGADALETFLMDEGVNAISIHGDKCQDEREYALKQFKNGRCPVLVATDVAARGLDIPNVLHVINYDMPSNVDDYVHRIGRTGRCGNVGNAHAFFNEKNRGIAKDLYDLLKECKQEIPGWLEDLVYSHSSNSGYGSSSYGRGRGGPRGRGSSNRFQTRDYRRSEDFSAPSVSSSSSSSAASSSHRSSHHVKKSNDKKPAASVSEKKPAAKAKTQSDHHPQQQQSLWDSFHTGSRDAW